MPSSDNTLVKPVSEVDFDLDIVADHQFKSLLLHFDRPTPADRLTCLMLGKYYALKNLETFRLKEKAAITALVAYQQPNNGRLMVNYQKMLDMNATAEQMAEFLSLHLITFHRLPDELTDSDVRREAVERCKPALGLACPTHQLLTTGGDERLRVHWEESDLNRLRVSPRPKTEMVIRSGSTACPPTDEGFERADMLRQGLLESALKGNLPNAFSREMENVRKKIIHLLHLDRMDSPPVVITTSSGTDAEMVIVQLALALASEATNGGDSTKYGFPDITNIFVSVDDLDQNKLKAGSLRHIGSLTPSGRIVSREVLEGAPDGKLNLKIYPDYESQNNCLKDLDTLENGLEQLIHKIIIDEGQLAILHLVVSSATGLSFPEPEFLVRLKQQYGKKLIAVADAVQMRCDERHLAAFVESGCCVLLTGSKFMGGPPFCGAVLLPVDEAASINDLVKGIGDYISTDDVDFRLPEIRKNLPGFKNYGLLLRWNAALEDMERYYALERKVRQDIISRWHETIVDFVADEPYLRVTQAEEAFKALHDCNRIGELATLVLVTLHPPNIVGDRLADLLEADSLEHVVAFMAADISTHLPSEADSTEHQIAARSCLPGQPVVFKPRSDILAALPVSIRAPDIVRCAEGEGAFQNVIEEDRLLIRKLSLVAKYFHHLVKAGIKTGN